MAEITSAQAGNWSDTATWAGGVVPGDGDTAIVNHAVTVDVDTIVGDLTDSVKVQNNNELTIGVNAKLTIKGNATFGTYERTHWGGLILSAGSEITDDANNRDIVNYNFKFHSSSTTDNWAKFSGTLAMPNSMASLNVMSRNYFLRYVSFTNTRALSFSSPNGSSSVLPIGPNVDIEHCVFEGMNNGTSTAITFLTNTSNSDINLKYVDFRNVTGGSSGSPAILFSGKDGYSKYVGHLTFDGSRMVRFSHTEYNAVDHIVKKGKDNATVNASNAEGLVFDKMAVYAKQEIFTSSMQWITGNVSIKMDNWYVYNDAVTVNTHGHGGPSPTATNGVIEDHGSGGGNFYTSASLNANVLDIQNNVIMSRDGQVFGTYDTGATFNFHNNTFVAFVNLGSTRAPVLHYENQAFPFGGTLFTSNNIFAGHSTNTIECLYRSNTVGGDIEVNEHHYNATWQVENLGGTTGGAVSVLSSIGNVELTSDPGFVDPTRGLLRWAQENFDPNVTTPEEAFDVLLRMNGYDSVTKTQTTPSGATVHGSEDSLVNWVRAGFVPTNQALKGAGEGGVDIGAMDVQTLETTIAPTTLAPTTAAPTTLAPTTAAPTTAVPTTLAPTTSAPTTLAPTTVGPTTAMPTTLAPTTLAPTTLAPTTAAPTTAAPIDPTTGECIFIQLAPVCASGDVFKINEKSTFKLGIQCKNFAGEPLVPDELAWWQGNPRSESALIVERQEIVSPSASETILVPAIAHIATRKNEDRILIVRAKSGDNIKHEAFRYSVTDIPLVPHDEVG